MRGVILAGAAGLAGADVGAVAGLQFEPIDPFDKGRSETCPTADLQFEPIDHWLFVCDWASARIRSETCFGEEEVGLVCDWASVRIRSESLFGEQGGAGVAGAPVKAAMPYSR